MPASRLPQPIASPAQGLAFLDRFSTMLQEAESFEDFTAVRDAAETFRNIAKTAKLGLEMQNSAAEVKLRAERRMGAFLEELGLHGGDRRSRSPGATLKLEDLQITKQQALTLRRISSVPEPDFERYLAGQNELGAEVTLAGLRRLAIEIANSPSRKPPRRSRPTEQTNVVTSWSEPLTELGDHLDLLQKLLRPVCQHQEQLLHSAERQHIQRLLIAMGKLLRQLTRINP